VRSTTVDQYQRRSVHVAPRAQVDAASFDGDVEDGWLLRKRIREPGWRALGFGLFRAAEPHLAAGPRITTVISPEV
jgi:hypothetical protein